MGSLAKIALCSCFLVLGLAAFVTFLTLLLNAYLHRIPFIDDSQECNLVERKSDYELTKELSSQWKWTYKNRDIKIQLLCPSSRHDTNIYYNDTYVGGTDIKIISAVTETLIIDCHGTPLFFLRTGNLFGTIINGNKILVNYEVRDAEDTIIAYSTGKHFITDEIELLDANREFTIATLTRNTFSTKWIWKIHVNSFFHEASDPLVLFSIAGMRSFAGKGTDGCNTFYWWSLYLTIITGILFIIGLTLLMYFTCKHRCMNGDKNESVQMREKRGYMLAK